MIDVFPVKYNDDFEISLMAKADGHSRCYGMLNWGDTVDQGYTVQGRGGGKLFGAIMNTIIHMPVHLCMQEPVSEDLWII